MALPILIGNAVFYVIFAVAMEKFVDVILPLPLHACFTYSLPEDMAGVYRLAAGWSFLSDGRNTIRLLCRTYTIPHRPGTR